MTTNSDGAKPRHDVRSSLLVVAVGVAAGFLAGLFGVGGGLVIVPALMAVLKMDQRTASATSLAAIMITAAVGAFNYGVDGQLSWVAAAFLVVGALAGTQVGVWLLRRLPDRILPWIFAGFVVAVIITQQFHAPVRDAHLELNVARGIALVLVGVLSGVFAGLVGVGGGSVIVPGLEVFAGVGDLMARGTSLLVMIPTSISGTLSNFRHGTVNLRVGLIVGVCAAAVTPLGKLVAGTVSPKVGNILFNIFLVCVVLNTIWKARKKRAK